MRVEELFCIFSTFEARVRSGASKINYNSPLVFCVGSGYCVGPFKGFVTLLCMLGLFKFYNLSSAVRLPALLSVLFNVPCFLF